jgi:hypothetical protein
LRRVRCTPHTAPAAKHTQTHTGTQLPRLTHRRAVRLPSVDGIVPESWLMYKANCLQYTRTSTTLASRHGTASSLSSATHLQVRASHATASNRITSHDTASDRCPSRCCVATATDSRSARRKHTDTLAHGCCHSWPHNPATGAARHCQAHEHTDPHRHCRTYTYTDNHTLTGSAKTACSKYWSSTAARYYTPARNQHRRLEAQPHRADRHTTLWQSRTSYNASALQYNSDT